MAEEATPAGGEMSGQPSSGNPTTAAGLHLTAPVNCTNCGRPNPAPGVQGNWGLPVYAIGRLTPQFASIGVEKEFAQLSGGTHQGDQVDVGLLQELLGSPENAYLGRHLCWVFASEGLDALQLLPRDAADIARFLEMLSPDESDDRLHVVIGTTVPISVNSPCASVGLPTVQADQVLAFTPGEFAAALPADETASSQDSSAGNGAGDRGEFEAAARRLFARLTGRAGNRGIADEHRALNYLACRYSQLYQAVWQAQSAGKALVRVDAQHSHSSDRRLVSVRLVFRQPRTDITEQYECLVDATEVFPYMVRGLRAVYD